MSTPLAPIDDLDPGLIPFAPAAWPFLATLPAALAATRDHSLSAQWEHTVLVTPTGHEVLTLGASEQPPA